MKVYTVYREKKYFDLNIVELVFSVTDQRIAEDYKEVNNEKQSEWYYDWDSTELDNGNYNLDDYLGV